MVDQAVVNSVQLFLRNLVNEGIPVRHGVVFGSQTTGKADEWSDIDLLVVSPKFDERKEWDDVTALWRVAARTDYRIEPIPVGEHQYHEDDSSAIIEIARRQGEVIQLAE